METTVSILMSVYNPNMELLKQALDSIDRQTYKDFELIMINDGCDNKLLLELLGNYNYKYTVIENSTNLGLTKSLNIGLKKCNGKYIARHDADDLMEENRLERQVDFLENNTDIACVFSNAKRVDISGNVVSVDTTDNNSSLVRRLIYGGNCLYHSSLMIRKEVLEDLKGYDEKIVYAQDYDLYLRLINKYKIYKISEPLICFRTDNYISKSKNVLSLLYSYYGSIKYVIATRKMSVFWVRTVKVISALHKALKG